MPKRAVVFVVLSISKPKTSKSFCYVALLAQVDYDFFSHQNLKLLYFRESKNKSLIFTTLSQSETFNLIRNFLKADC